MGGAGGRRRLYELIRRYRAEIRADLQERYGVDLARWWRERRFRALLDLVDQLPGASRLNEAIQNDPEQAEVIARNIDQLKQRGEGERGQWSPRVAEYDLHANLLRDLIQSVLGLRAAVIASAGGKPGSVPTYPVPVTEVDRATARLERAWAQGVLEQFGFSPDDF